MEIFHSSEIRWFSKSKDTLESIFDELPGVSTDKEERTDLYLNSYSTNTGVKIREGKHEIKVKNRPDGKSSIGSLEDWTKWSSSPVQNILNSVDRSMINNWQEIKKTRIKKQYEIKNGSVIHNNNMVKAGCGIEFTKVETIINGDNNEWYTFGLEAFGDKEKCRAYLKLIIEELQLTDNSLKNMLCMSYPAFIAKINNCKY